MKTCPNCHAAFDDTVSFCSICGKPLEETPVQEDVNPTESAPQTEAQPQADVSANQQPETNTSYSQPNASYDQPNMQQPYGQQASYDQRPPYQTNYQYQQPGYTQQPYTPPVMPYDHTAEFTAEDISKNKVLAMVAYLLGIFGIIVALLAMHESDYVGFHVRQSLKMTVVEALLGIVAAVFFWTFVLPIVAGIGLVIVLVLRIIAFFQVCSGKAKEPAIIRELGFLK